MPVLKPTASAIYNECFITRIYVYTHTHKFYLLVQKIFKLYFKINFMSSTRIYIHIYIYIYLYIYIYTAGYATLKLPLAVGFNIGTIYSLMLVQFYRNITICILCGIFIGIAKENQSKFMSKVFMLCKL